MRWDVTSRRGFVECYDATFRDVYRAAARLCGSDRSRAEDLVHEVYLGVLRRARAGELVEVGVGYLRTAVRHRFLDQLRSAERERARLALVREREAPGQQVVVPPLLADLPERERVALVLRYVDDLTVAGVAAEMGIGVRAAESLLARARSRLRREEGSVG